MLLIDSKRPNHDWSRKRWNRWRLRYHLFWAKKHRVRAQYYDRKAEMHLDRCDEITGRKGAN